MQRKCLWSDECVTVLPLHLLLISLPTCNGMQPSFFFLFFEGRFLSQLLSRPRPRGLIWSGMHCALLCGSYILSLSTEWLMRGNGLESVESKTQHLENLLLKRTAVIFLNLVYDHNWEHWKYLFFGGGAITWDPAHNVTAFRGKWSTHFCSTTQNENSSSNNNKHSHLYIYI